MTTFPHYITTLDYLPLTNIFVPSEVPSNNLMILLHGRGGKAEDFSWIPEKFAFDDMHYLILNAKKTYDDGYSWYDDIPYHNVGIQHSSALLTQTLELLFTKDFDASSSFLFGFSQGALLTFEFGARYKKKLAGYIAISGHLNDPTCLLQEMNSELKNANWLCTHGTSDEALDFTKAKHHIEQLQNAGLQVEFKSYDKGHNIIESEIDMIKTWIQRIVDSHNK